MQDGAVIDCFIEGFEDYALLVTSWFRCASVVARSSCRRACLGRLIKPLLHVGFSDSVRVRFPRADCFEDRDVE